MSDVKDPWLKLAEAILIMAIQDAAVENNLEARSWVQSVGLAYAEMLGFNAENIKSWLDRGMPVPQGLGRRWQQDARKMPAKKLKQLGLKL